MVEKQLMGWMKCLAVQGGGAWRQAVVPEPFLGEVPWMRTLVFELDLACCWRQGLIVKVILPACVQEKLLLFRWAEWIYWGCAFHRLVD